MYCPNCKQEFDGKFCPECGTKLIEKTQRVCPNCNIEVESKFCPECGAKIVEMAVKATATGEIVAAGQQEDAETCYRTAQDYYYGKNGKNKDDEAAAQWYLKAAEQGHVESYYCLGSMLKEVCELEDAIGCFQEAAELGHAAAQYELGVAYSLGLGIEQNNEESMKWYRKAAEQGHEEAIGFLEELGERVPAGGEDGAEKWYLKAAEQGNEEAIEYQKKSLTNMDNKEIFCEIFEQYGSMVISSCFGEDTFKKWLESEVFEETGCMLYQVDDMTLERFNTIAELFITHTDIDVNDRQKLALMVLLYVVLWDDVDDSNLKIEYNGEVLIDKPKNEVFEEYKSYLEKIAEYVPAYEPVDSDDEEDEDCDDEWNDDEDEDDEWNDNAMPTVENLEFEITDPTNKWVEVIGVEEPDVEDVIIPSSITIGGEEYMVTSIGEAVFGWCESLTSITIPSSVTSIGPKTFGGCKSLTSIAIPSSVTSIGDRAFNGCSSLTSITIPSSVTSIGEGAFGWCDNLTSITIPSSVTSIGEGAFNDCESLTSVTIPSSVTSIGDKVFRGCRSLTSITIPSSVTSIGDRAFWKCDNLTSITIPSSVTSIGEGAFGECDNLTSITIPSSVTSIGNDAFEGCSSLTSITIPSSVISIGEKAFLFCKNLTSITIPTHITNIDKLGVPEETRIIRENV